MAEKPEVRPRDPMQRLPRTPRDMLQLFETVDVFQETNLRERATLAEIAEVVRCAGGTKVFEAGEEGRYLYCVLQGRLELRAAAGPGTTHHVRGIPAGRLAGLDAVLTQQPYHLACFAVENTAALRFQTTQLHQMLAMGTPAAVKLFSAMRTELGSAIRDATMQVAKLLEATAVRGSSLGSARLETTLSGVSSSPGGRPPSTISSTPGGRSQGSVSSSPGGRSPSGVAVPGSRTGNSSGFAIPNPLAGPKR